MGPNINNAVKSILEKRSAKGDTKMSPTPMKAETKTDETGEVDGRHLAAQDMIAAFHEKSPQKLMEAMGNFYDLHQIHSKKETEPDGGKN